MTGIQILRHHHEIWYIDCCEYVMLYFIINVMYVPGIIS
jgi:hypothetical protein